MEQLDLVPQPDKPRPAKPNIPPPARKLVRRKPEPPPPAPQPETLFLGIKHTINGISYGPGVCEVPGHLLSVIKENEARSASEERALYERRANVIAAGNRVV